MASRRHGRYARGMPLSPDRHKVLDSHFQEKWKNKACTLCGVTAWLLTEGYVTLTVAEGLHGGGAWTIGPVSALPLVIFTCSSCGHTVFLNALVAGVPPPRLGEPANALLPSPSPARTGGPEGGRDG